MSDGEDPVAWLRAQVEADLRMKRVLLSSKSPFTRKDAEFRVADCEAKLAILDEHGPSWADYRDGDGIERTTLECKTCEPTGTPDNWPCRTVRLLLSGYRFRPGCREEWATTP